MEGGGQGDKHKVWKCANKLGTLQSVPGMNGRLRDFSGNRGDMNRCFRYDKSKTVDIILLASKKQKSLALWLDQRNLEFYREKTKTKLNKKPQ